jgi:hypothetical protein
LLRALNSTLTLLKAQRKASNSLGVQNPSNNL